MACAMIRSVEYLKDRNLLTTFINTNKEIPIVYEYAQKKTINPMANPMRAKDVIEPSSIIGYASNIHIDGDGVVCNVTLLPLNILSDNFMGVIDNYVIKVNKSGTDSESEYEIVRFIVYDKEFKRKVDEERARQLQ